MMTLCIYEDEAWNAFRPLTYLRPVCLLRPGIFPLYRRIARHFPDARVTLAARDAIAPLVTAEVKDCPVNIVKRPEQGAVLFVNGRLREPGDLPRLVAEARLSTVYRNGRDIVAVLFTHDIAQHAPAVATPAQYVELLEREREGVPDFDTTATLYARPWEIVGDIESALADDFAAVGPGKADNAVVLPGAAVLEDSRVFLGDGTEVAPGAVIDARHGPVYIGANTRVESHAAIYGPCYLGPNTIVTAGKISCSSIGHTCRVGGEVEESVFHAYVNKYHAGFIGHSYVCPWVNFGAMTTNSDLKNNYSNVRVTIGGESIDTGEMKVGSFIGDHTKFGIGTLLTTGITIGVCCNLFGGVLIADKEVPSFRWGHTGDYSEYQFDKAVETARRTASRRGVTLSEAELACLKGIQEGNLPTDGILCWPPER